MSKSTGGWREARCGWLRLLEFDAEDKAGHRRRSVLLQLGPQNPLLSAPTPSNGVR